MFFRGAAMSAYRMQEFVQLARYGGADALAKDVLASQKEANGFLARALFFANHYGTALPEANALCALALQSRGESEQALYHWHLLVKRFPQDMRWLTTAIKHVIGLRKTLPLANTLVHRWLRQVQALFLAVPDSTFLQDLESQGFHLQGSCGLHQGYLHAWLWLPRKECIKITGSANAPHISLEPLPVHATPTHSLYTIKAELPQGTEPYTLSISDSKGRQLTNSPLVISQATSLFAAKARRSPSKAHLAILIPCFDDRKATMACLASVFKSQKASKTRSTVVVIWDHGPNLDLLSDLRRLAALGKIILRENPRNLGFLASVNACLGDIVQSDIVLLNADTLVCGDWIDRMHTWLTRPDAGTVTALGSDAELVSYPSFSERAQVKSLAQLRPLDACAKALPRELALLEIPVGVGFCMGIARRALDRIGGFDGLFLYNGYGEEVDFCLRVSQAGLNNYAAMNIFVAHRGERSFGARKKALAAQNNTALFARYPDYRKAYQHFIQADPLNEAKESLARALCQYLEKPTLRLRPSLDADLPERFFATSHSDDDFPWSTQSPKKSQAPKNSEGHLFLGHVGDVLRLRLKIKSRLPFACMHFTLPKDAQLLRKTLADCHFQGIVATSYLHKTLKEANCAGDPHGLCKLLASLALPTIPDDASPNETLSPTPWKPKPPEEEDLLLVLPPRTRSGWQRLSALAKLHPNWLFFVPALTKIWQGALTPANILQAHTDCAEQYRTCSAILVPPGLDPQCLDLFRQWLWEHHLGHLPCHALEEAL